MSILMELVSIMPSAIDKYYDILLIEQGGKRVLSIPVGEYEGQNIALSLDKVEVSRPLTFDLLCQIMSKANVKAEYIYINKFIDGTFFANLCSLINGEEVCFDSRCSDAINLAVKLSLPIFVAESVLENAGFEITPPNQISKQTCEEDDWTIEELEIILKEVEEEGDEEIAKVLREKIKSLQKED
jgi:bifunctional DNase/RNase